MTETGLDEGAPFGRICGDGLGDFGGVQDGEDVNGVGDVLFPLGDVPAALADDELVEAVVPWIGDVEGDAAVDDLDGIVEEHPEEPEGDRVQSKLFDEGRLFVAPAGFGGEEFEFQIRVLEEGGAVGVVPPLKAQGFEIRFQVLDLPGEIRPGDEEIDIDGLEREDPDAEVLLVYEETPTTDELQAVLPEPGLIEDLEDGFYEVILHEVPTGDV